MKLFGFLTLALSASASTLLAPLYEVVANQVIGIAQSALTGIKTTIGNAGQSTVIVEQFEVALAGLDSAVVVDILQQIPLETILEGGLTADDLALVFADQATFAAIDFTAMQNEFISGLDVDTVAQLNQAMEAFVQATESLQKIFDSEISIYNFVAVITDTADAVSRLDDIYGFAGANMAMVYDAIFYISLASEKALFIIENRLDYIYMYQDAIALTKTEFERRISGDLDAVCDDTFDAIDLALTATEFASTVVLDNWGTPFEETIMVWNNLVGNVVFLDDYQIPSTVIDATESAVRSMVDSVKGSLVEINVLLIPFKSVINPTVQNMVFGC